MKKLIGVPPAGESGDRAPGATRAGGAAPEALLERATQENFPVASRVLPQRVRGHLMAVYGYARLVDHIGDEAEGDRLAMLASLEQDVDRLYASGDARHPILRALHPTIQRFAIPDTVVRALIEANRRDQLVSRYETFDDLLEYCSLSANPVGHMVLSIFEASTPRHRELSDRICTGLQLAEHWQDVAEDFVAGRIYLPLEDLDRFRVTEDELARNVGTERFRQLMAYEVARAHRFLDDGIGLISAVDGMARFAVAAFVAGGRSALRAIELAGHDVLVARAPRPSRPMRLRMLAATLWAGRRFGQRGVPCP